MQISINSIQKISNKIHNKVSNKILSVNTFIYESFCVTNKFIFGFVSLTNGCKFLNFIGFEPRNRKTDNNVLYFIFWCVCVFQTDYFCGLNKFYEKNRMVFNKFSNYVNNFTFTLINKNWNNNSASKIMKFEANLP